MKDVCEAVPFGTLVDCHLNLNLTNAQVGTYAAAFQIEDFKNETDTYAMSSVNLKNKIFWGDLLMNIF